MMTTTIKLPHRFEVWVPVSKMRTEHKREVIATCGGLTIQNTIGSWVDSQGALITEPVYILQFAGPLSGIDVVHSLVEQLLDAGEQAVFWTMDGKAHITEKADE